MPDLTVTGALASGKAAYKMAKLGPADVDAWELYDAFTINTILFLEDLGFCEKGAGGGYVEGGAIAPGGRLPVNTNGGGLSCVHPGMYGIFTIIEAVRQLRGQAESARSQARRSRCATATAACFRRRRPPFSARGPAPQFIEPPPRAPRPSSTFPLTGEGLGVG